MDKEIINIDTLYQKVASLIDKGQQAIVRTIDYTQLFVNYQIGRYIIEDEQHGNRRAQYGKNILASLSERLTLKYDKGYSVKNLELMRNFYLQYSKSQTVSAIFERNTNNPGLQSDNQINTIPQTLSAELSDDNKNHLSEISQTVSGKFSKANLSLLSWSHYVFLMQIDNPEERSFYEIEALQNNWSLREMKRQFNSGLYERLALSRDKKGIRELATKGQLIEKPFDLLKEPLVLEFLNLTEHYQYSEKELETAIIDRIQEFMLELGKGFLFESRQKRISFNEKHFYIDLTFYNRLLNCFVLIDLKIGELSHENLGQMQMYVNYYDRFIKTETENPTIGIVLCKKKEQSLVEITLPENNNQIFAAKYQTVLPNKEQLKQILEAEYGK